MFGSSQVLRGIISLLGSGGLANRLCQEEWVPSPRRFIMKVQGASIIILASRRDPYSGGEQELMAG